MLVLAVCAAFIIITAGCKDKEQNQSDIKKSRLIAVEKDRLQKELEDQKAACQQEIEKLNELRQKDLGMQKSSKQEFIKLANQILKDIEEIRKLREENKMLKAQIILPEDQNQLKTETK
jgi:membrane-associated HD superfamily phosphohydrolase